VNGHRHIGTAQVPDGVELRLMRRGGEFTIVLDGNELMSTRVSASEEALARLTCERLSGRASPQLLIGGYGMGFTLRAALAALDADASMVVAEIVPEIIEWALGHMSALTADCLNDPRVMVVQDDVAMLIDAAHEAYDAILLDVDNGPDGLVRRVNDWLYYDDAFTTRLAEAGFAVEEVSVPERANGRGARHVIWFATKAGPLSHA
jgi:spermidine synthase